MSIDKVHKLLENKSCAIGCFGVMALMFLVSFVSFSPNCQASRNEGIAEGPEAARVGDIPVRSMAIDFASNLLQSQNQNAETSNPGERARVLASAVGSVIDAAYVQLLAKREGVASTPDTAEQAVPSLWKQQIDQQKMFLELTQQIKPNATEAEIAEALKKQGIDLPAQKVQFETMFKQRLADPASQQAVLAEISQRSLLEKYAAGKLVQEEDVKAGFDTYQFKRILLAEKGEEGKKRADELLAELKSGASFEGLMERHSIDKPVGKERKRDRLEPITWPVLKTDPQYATLRGAKAGDVRGPIELAEGTAIYKLIKVDRTLPPDYDQRRAEYRDGYVKSLARDDLQAKLKELKAANPPEWKSKGFKVLYEFSQLSTDPDAPGGTAKAERLKALLAEAKAQLESTDPSDARAAALATYAIQDEIWTSTPLAERDAIRADRIEALELALRDVEDVGIRLELVDLAIAAKDRERAVNQLVAAAQANVEPSNLGQSRYYLIAAKLSQLKKLNFIGAEEATTVETEQARWRSDRVAMQQAEAEQKKRDEEDRKKFEEEARKAQEEAKKNAPKANDRADAPKAGG